MELLRFTNRTEEELPGEFGELGADDGISSPGGSLRDTNVIRLGVVLVWVPGAVAHMSERHRLTPVQAEEVLDDPYVVKLSPDPASKSGKSDRYIGMCARRGILVVIVVRFAGESYRANAWPANSFDRKLYWENRNR